MPYISNEPEPPPKALNQSFLYGCLGALGCLVLLSGLIVCGGAVSLSLLEQSLDGLFEDVANDLDPAP